jgi:hypothetical protein
MSVEKNTVMYKSGTWVRKHDACVLWKGHNIVRMLLTGHIIRICQYCTYRRDQEGMFLT